MIDLEDLRRKAEAAGADKWEVSGSYDNQNCYVAPEGYGVPAGDWRMPKAIICKPGIGSHTDAYAAFIAAANPATILALIAEIERRDTWSD